MDADMPGVGIVRPPDLKATAGSGMQSSIAAGRARIRANYLGVDHGVYELWSDSAVAVTHPTAGANPRVDQILARMKDSDEGSGVDLGDFYVAAGTASAPVTLDNRTGVAAVDPATVLIADVLVPAGAGSSASFTYRDRRPFAGYGMVPPLISAVEMVPMIYRGMVVDPASYVSAMNNFQMEAVAYLPQRIVATKIRWTYLHAGTAQTGNYNIGIYDSSGRKIVETGSVAITGSANTRIVRSETISSTILEAGIYHVLIGLASLSVGTMFSLSAMTGSSSTPSVSGPNLMSSILSGGITLPSNIFSGSWFDAHASAQVRCVPQIALSTA